MDQSVFRTFSNELILNYLKLYIWLIIKHEAIMQKSLILIFKNLRQN